MDSTAARVAAWPDDAVFAMAILVSVLLGIVMRSTCRAQTRVLLATAAGTLVALATGAACLAHALFQIAAIFCVLKRAPQELKGPLCATAAFAYLALLRIAHLQSGAANALQLMLTLKLASVGFDAADGNAAPTTLAQLYQYCFCYFGIITGPFFSYDDWVRAMQASYVQKQWPTRARRALASAIFAILVWQGIHFFLPYSHIQEQYWTDSPFIYRFAYFYVSSFQFRYRFYSCWLVMEAAGEVANFSVTSNVNLIECEGATSIIDFVAAWNTSVHRFLRDFVYSRLPLRSRVARRACTFIVSAFWHGIRPGYYLFFAGVFAMILTETFVRDLVLQLVGFAVTGGSSFQNEVHTKLISVAGHFWTLSLLTFFGAGFNILNFTDTIDVWKSLHFYGVQAIILPLGASIIYHLAKARRKESTRKK